MLESVLLGRGLLGLEVSGKGPHSLLDLSLLSERLTSGGLSEGLLGLGVGVLPLGSGQLVVLLESLAQVLEKSDFGLGECHRVVFVSLN